MVKRGSRAPKKAGSAEKPGEDRNDPEHSGIRANAAWARGGGSAERERCWDTEGIAIFLGQLQGRIVSDGRKKHIKVMTSGMFVFCLRVD